MKNSRNKIISSLIFSSLLMMQNNSFASVVDGKADNDQGVKNTIDDLSQKELKTVTTIASRNRLGNEFQRYEIDESRRIKALISFGVQNRFQIKDKKIKEVIGQGFLYKINSDESSTHVFITPLATVEETIDLTLIYDNDKAVDLSLKVGEGASQSVLIQEKELATNDSRNFSDEKTAITHLLKTMIKDRKSKYDVEKLNKSIVNILSGEENSNLSFVIDRKYGWAKDNLKGFRVVVKNQGQKRVWVNKEILKDLFEDVKIVHISNNNLLSQESSFAYVIRQDSRFGQNGGRE